MEKPPYNVVFDVKEEADGSVGANNEYLMDGGSGYMQCSEFGRQQQS